MARKPRQTDAFKVFKANMERAQAFVRIFNSGRTRGQPSNDEKELLRGSLVFAVGALDAYLSDLVLEVVPEYAPQSKQLSEALKAIAKNDPGLALRVSLISNAEQRKAEFRAALGEWLETKSFHGPEKVQAALSYVGCSITWHEFDKATEVETARELDQVTEERHSIVHRGKRPYVTRDRTEGTHNLLSSIADLVDKQVLELHG